MHNMIAFQNVSKEYAGRRVLDNITLQIKAEEIVSLIGPSGAGKSTFFNLLMGSIQPTEGVIKVDDFVVNQLNRDMLQTYRRHVGMIFQDYKLLPNKTVHENIAFALEVCDAEDDYIEHKVGQLLIKMQIEHARDLFPKELSGGEQQRVAIARALCHDPRLILADEPTGDLDPEQSKEIIDILKGIHQDGVTVILSSHDKDIVNMLDSRVIRIEQGKIVADQKGEYISNN